MYKITYLTRRGNTTVIVNAIVSLARLEAMRAEGYSILTADRVR